MRSPSVLHIHKVSGVSGSERHLGLLLPGLAARGWDVRALLLPVGNGDRAIEMLRDLSVDVDALPPGPDANPVLVGRMVKAFRHHRPDLVHTHLIHADLHGQAAARLAGIPGVSSMHATHSFYERPPVRPAARGAGRLAARTIAISDHVWAFARRLDLVPEDRLRMVHYGIDVNAWVVAPAAREAARAELGLNPADVAVGVASRMVAHKGHDVLLEAMARAQRESPSLRLLVAGDGPLRPELEARAGAQLPPGIARLVGFIDDVPSFMAACDVMVFPTLPGFGEGFGLAALEAMAAGRALIATSLDSLPEIVVPDETGFLVQPGAVEEMAAALVRLAGDEGLRVALGDQGRARARAAFTIEAMVDRTVTVYEEALQSNKS